VLRTQALGLLVALRYVPTGQGMPTGLREPRGQKKPGVLAQTPEQVAEEEPVTLA
jgi:hypothetical protein